MWKYRLIQKNVNNATECQFYIILFILDHPYNRIFARSNYLRGHLQHQVEGGVILHLETYFSRCFIVSKHQIWNLFTDNHQSKLKLQAKKQNEANYSSIIAWGIDMFTIFSGAEVWSMSALRIVLSRIELFYYLKD